jgi:imidazolonepropionase-like amidohydrolase
MTTVGRYRKGGAEPQVFPCLCHSPAFARVNAIVEQKLSRRAFLAGTAAALGATALWPKAALASIPDAPKTPLAFTNVRLFDGKSGRLITGRRVIVDGNKIKAIEPDGQPVAAGIQVIDCGGRTLMPGLIDAHWHAMLAAVSVNDLNTADAGYINLIAADQAEKTLMRGFTTIRDMAGPSFGLKRAIDSGLTAGPRIFPSGAMISQTSGHGDFRMPYEVPAAPDAPLSHGDAAGTGAIADGVDQVLKRSREQLMLGASQLKLAAGGGVASNYDPIDVCEYTESEFRAAVDAAANWGTYVAVHAYTPLAIQTAIRGGVKSIEHGHLMDEDTAKIIADKGIWLCTQPFCDDFAAPFPEGSVSRAKQLQVFAGTDRAYEFAKQHKLKTAWGTDVLFDGKLCGTQGAQVAKMAKWYAPEEVLRMVTSVNAELCAMSGPRNPYPGKLGVVEADAYADLILINGDPIADINLVADPEKNLKIVMKDGRIYKNTLA